MNKMACLASRERQRRGRRLFDLVRRWFVLERAGVERPSAPQRLLPAFTRWVVAAKPPRRDEGPREVPGAPEPAGEFEHVNTIETGIADQQSAIVDRHVMQIVHAGLMQHAG